MRWNGIDYDRTGEGEPLLLLHGRAVHGATGDP
jgi:hypothetical protein